MPETLLITEDDLALANVLSGYLQDEGFITDIATTGSQALLKLEITQPSLVLLDLGLPDIQGETILKKIRETYHELPVIILTAKSQPQEIAAGLNLGADDYLAKPFNTEELLARINARLKKNTFPNVLKLGSLIVDLSKKTVRRGDFDINLTKTEFELLVFLLKNSGKVINRKSILNAVWGYSPNVESRVVDIYIGYLRNKIDYGYKKKLIKNRRGFGYTIDL